MIDINIKHRHDFNPITRMKKYEEQEKEQSEKVSEKDTEDDEKEDEKE